jgi:hypothetical protein
MVLGGEQERLDGLGPIAFCHLDPSEPYFRWPGSRGN